MATSDVMPRQAAERRRRGVVVPAMPLALTRDRKLDERRQRGLVRYYLAAGAGGVAAGVHTTQFAIREPRHGLFRPVLTLVAEELARHEAKTGKSPIRVAGICGPTGQAGPEAPLEREPGFHAGRLKLSPRKEADDRAPPAPCRACPG